VRFDETQKFSINNGRGILSAIIKNKFKSVYIDAKRQVENDAASIGRAGDCDTGFCYEIASAFLDIMQPLMKEDIVIVGGVAAFAINPVSPLIDHGCIHPTYHCWLECDEYIIDPSILQLNKLTTGREKVMLTKTIFKKSDCSSLHQLLISGAVGMHYAKDDDIFQKVVHDKKAIRSIADRGIKVYG